MTSPHRNMEIHHEHTSLIKSPRDQRSTLDPTTATSNNKMKRPLTRKKWLESSEGGFIFGSPSEGEGTIKKCEILNKYHVHVY